MIQTHIRRGMFFLMLFFLTFHSFSVALAGDGGKIIIVKRYLIFFSKKVTVDRSHKKYEKLMEQASIIIRNAYGNRKTFNRGNDLTGSDHISVYFGDPIEIQTSSFATTKTTVFNATISVVNAITNIPIVINDDLPVFSKYEDYFEFISTIENIISGDNLEN